MFAASGMYFPLQNDDLIKIWDQGHFNLTILLRNILKNILQVIIFCVWGRKKQIQEEKISG